MDIKKIRQDYITGKRNLVQTVRDLMMHFDEIHIYSKNIATQLKAIESQTDHVVISTIVPFSGQFMVANDQEITELERFFGKQLRQILAAIEFMISSPDEV
jgi:hypothetical protein